MSDPTPPIDGEVEVEGRSSSLSPEELTRPRDFIDTTKLLKYCLAVSGDGFACHFYAGHMGPHGMWSPIEWRTRAETAETQLAEATSQLEYVRQMFKETDELRHTYKLQLAEARAEIERQQKRTRKAVAEIDRLNAEAEEARTKLERVRDAGRRFVAQHESVNYLGVCEVANVSLRAFAATLDTPPPAAPSEDAS